jgi:uncharacterized protein (DUF1697 family)
MAERFVAFVRNVMIGREGLHRVVLLDLFEGAGAGTPRSYISTGNVTFSTRPTDLGAITRAVETGIEHIIGRREPVFVRSISYLLELVDSDPFAAAPYPDPYECTASFLLHPTDLPDLPVESPRGDVSVFAGTNRELFAVNRMVDGRTGGAGGMIEKLLGEPVTTRSWNTVRRVVDDPE